MLSVYEPVVREGQLWYLDVKSLPVGLQSKLQRRAETGYGDPRTVSLARLERLDSEAASLESELRDAVRDSENPEHLRYLEWRLQQTQAKKQQTLSGEWPAGLTLDQGKWVMAAAPVVAMGTFAVLAGIDVGFPIVVFGPVALGALMFALPFLSRLPDALDLSKSELELVRGAARSMSVATENRVSTLVARRDQPRNVPDLMGLAAHQAQVVTTSIAWMSSYLEPHRAQFDVAEEIRQIARNATQYETMLQRLNTSPTGSTRSAELANTAQGIARQQLDFVWQTLCRRVDALAEFASHIGQLDIELRNADLARQAMDMDADLTELMAGAASNEIAASQLRHMSDQTAALTAAIHELVNHLHNDLQTLRALAP